MVRKLNGFLITRKRYHKCLVMARLFNSAKMSCMDDHAKPTIWDFSPDHIILQCGTNDSNFDRTSGQIAREITDLALSLRSDKDKISISLLIHKAIKTKTIKTIKLVKWTIVWWICYRLKKCWHWSFQSDSTKPQRAIRIDTGQ